MLARVGREFLADALHYLHRFLLSSLDNPKLYADERGLVSFAAQAELGNQQMMAEPEHKRTTKGRNQKNFEIRVSFIQASGSLSKIDRNVLVNPAGAKLSSKFTVPCDNPTSDSP